MEKGEEKTGPTEEDEGEGENIIDRSDKMIKATGVTFQLNLATNEGSKKNTVRLSATE